MAAADAIMWWCCTGGEPRLEGADEDEETVDRMGDCLKEKLLGVDDEAELMTGAPAPPPAAAGSCSGVSWGPGMVSGVGLMGTGFFRIGACCCCWWWWVS